MKKWYIAITALLLVVAVSGVVLWMNHVEYQSQVKHETSRWAVIEDVNGDKIAVEPTSDSIWSELVQLNQNGTRMFVGGIVERYDNKWGLRFKPETVTVAQFTAEGLQATIRDMSEDVDYWLNLGWAYVGAKVVEIHSET